MPSKGMLWQAGQFRFFDSFSSQKSEPAVRPAASEQTEWRLLSAESAANAAAVNKSSPDGQDAGSSVHRFGLSEVYRPSSTCNVDLVFVHGLSGDPQRTWTSKESGTFWPRDLLPSFIEEQKARVLVYGYDADVASLGARGVTKDKIHNHAERLVADLFANRRIRKATERPIIFIAHSLGGLVVKRALLASSEISGAKTEHLRSIYVSTYGILFLGTPHKGSDLAKWGSYLSVLCQTVLPNRLISSESHLIDALRANSETLLNIDRQFAQLIDDFHIFFFHEAKPTDLKGHLQYIVDEESAAPTLPDVERAGIEADHSHMCKFDSDNAPGFDLVVDGIQRYSDDAPAIIRNRWVMEKRERQSRAARKAQENFSMALEGMDLGQVRSGRASSEVSPGQSIIATNSQQQQQKQITDSAASLPRPHKPTEPFFIVPPGFRANTFFVGMEKEMHELDRRLFDSRRRDGTACVLLHGQPGAGKTHVARQYVYKNRYKFQGGVFWINAQLIDEVYKDFWQIHQKIVAKMSSDHTNNVNEDSNRNFVDEVREWFCDREEWLIVFDGVSVEHNKDIDELQRCVPDSSNSAIIYVSRSRRLETMQALLRPCAIKISGLKEQDAQDLLFKEIGLRSPRPAQIKSAKILAKKVGGLPLAISAIARRLADTHEPIEKFNIKSYSDDPKLGGTYHHIMTDLRKNGHMEAMHLMNLLCFFGPHIPVEMIRIGLKSLSVEGVTVKASEEGVHPDINVTFGILMRHALLERNEPDDEDSISSGRDSCVDPEPIDVLNLHAVIQRYWCDSLNTSNQLQLWLARAANLLIYSFHEADSRIRQQPKPGRLSDYRWYLIHARRLRSHTQEYDSKQHPLTRIKAGLDAIIESIKAEIDAREASSSQESFNQVEFETSIFDRTSSTSSTDPSQTNLPRLSRLNTEDFEDAILDDSPPVIDSFDRDARPRLQFPMVYAYPMPRDPSGSMIRPVTVSQNESQSLQRSDSFRSSSATPLIDRGHARGFVSGSPPPTGMRDEALPPSNALSYLARFRVQQPSLQNRTGSRMPETEEELQQAINNEALLVPLQYNDSHASPVTTPQFSHSAPDGPPSMVNISAAEFDALSQHGQRSRVNSTTQHTSLQPNDLRGTSQSGDSTPRVGSREYPGRASSIQPLSSQNSPEGNQQEPTLVDLNALQSTTTSRIRSMSPCPTRSDQPYSSPLPSRSFIASAPPVDHPFALPADPANAPPRSFEQVTAKPQRPVPYIVAGLRAPYSDPLPTIAGPLRDYDNSDAAHPDVEYSSFSIPINGLGIDHGGGRIFRLGSPNSATHQGLGSHHSNRPSTTGFEEASQLRRPRASDSHLQYFSPSHRGSSNDLTGVNPIEEFTDIPRVSFAPPGMGTDNHRRVGSAVDMYGQRLLQHQQILLHQRQLSPHRRVVQHPSQTFLDPFATGGPAVIGDYSYISGRPMSPLQSEPRSLREQRSPNRNSAPYPLTSPISDNGGDDAGTAQGVRTRRRTLSAPESPGWGPGTEHNLWSS